MGTAVGVACVIVAAVGAGRADDLRAQVRWLNVGTIGVVVLGAGNVVWYLVGRRANGALRRRVHAALAAQGRGAPIGASATSAPSGESGATASASGALVAGRGMTRFHRPDCLLVAGKTVRPATEATHHRRGRRPCGVCLLPERR